MASELPRVILVFGATGRQGGSVVDELLRRGPTKYRVRAATRDVTSEKAGLLASRGVEVVRADLTKLIENEDDQDYRLAVRGCYGLFLMTDYWTPGVGGHETTIGRRAAKIAKEEGVQHIIWSTLPDPASLSSGRLEVPHFADKALVDETIKELQFKYHSFILIGFYYQNFAAGYSKPKIKPDGTVVFTLGNLEGDDKLAVFDVEDTGPIVVAAFANPEEWGNGSYLSMCSELIPMKEVAEVFAKVTGKKAVIEPLDISVIPDRKIRDMWIFKKEQSEHPWGPHLDWKTGLKAYPEMMTWERWLRKTGFNGGEPLVQQA